MHAPFLRGSRVTLRALEDADLDGPYLTWLNDREVTRWMESGLFPTRRADLARFRERMESSEGDVLFAICAGERHVGNIGLHAMHPVFRTAEIGLLIGERDVWGQGLGSEAIGLVAGYAFGRLDVHRLYAGAVRENAGCVRAFEKAGFVQEGVAREAYFCEGAHRDVVQLGLLRGEWTGDAD